MMTILSWPQSVKINSSPPNAAYMLQWTGSALVQVMGCRLFGPSHYLNQYWFIVNWTPGNKFQWNSDRNSIVFIQENASEIVVCQNGGHFVQREMSLKKKMKLWTHNRLFPSSSSHSISSFVLGKSFPVQVRCQRLWLKEKLSISKGPQLTRAITWILIL